MCYSFRLQDEARTPQKYPAQSHTSAELETQTDMWVAKYIDGHVARLPHKPISQPKQPPSGK